ncbi:hypothetical protein XocBAI15_18825 [Xanthomonas oryzae pv. oryzicola]|nr:hypothetical protein XocBAI15_18825 [Xanthomonas oryzae pv. oryzicola]OWB25972.1 hypothetical protein XocBAI21_19315 [Xanthomonas oryzae pv. oryzicola]OWB27126.1 hypothetical protein XocBAI20_14360 [Xanthomonas oryzae pv. oryzicola]
MQLNIARASPVPSSAPAGHLLPHEGGRCPDGRRACYRFSLTSMLIAADCANLPLESDGCLLRHTPLQARQAASVNAPSMPSCTSTGLCSGLASALPCSDVDAHALLSPCLPADLCVAQRNGASRCARYSR